MWKKLHKTGKYLALALSAAMLAVAVPAQQVQAVDLKELGSDMLPGIVKEASDALDNKDSGIGKMVDAYLPGLTDGLKDAEKMKVLQKAIVDILNSDWFKNATLKEKTDAICDVLDALGIENTDEIRKNVDKILEFDYDGQEYLVILEDVFEDLLDDVMWEAPAFEVENPNARVDKDALIMYGLGFPQFEKALDRSVKDWSAYGLDTKIDKDCTIDDFKTQLKDNDLIVIEEHGNFDYMNVSLIITEERISDANDAKYADDLEAERIIPVIFSEGAYYCIQPDFFRYYYKNKELDGTIVWVGSCSGNKSNALVDALVDAGADAVVGHSEEVYTAYDYSLLNSSVAELVQSHDMVEALDKAKSIWGENDLDYARNHLGLPESQLKEYASYPCLTGNQSFAE